MSLLLTLTPLVDRQQLINDNAVKHSCNNIKYVAQTLKIDEQHDHRSSCKCNMVLM